MSERDYPRLKALVMLNRSAESLDMCELLRLAEDPACPSKSNEAYEWAIRYAIPMISELQRRLDRLSKQADDRSRTMRLLQQMRKAQRGKDKELTEALEAKVDTWLYDNVQPTLFEEVTS